MKLEVGQTLWFVYSNHHRPGLGTVVTVEKIGRKWAQLDKHLRIDINTGCADGGQYISPGKAYLSKEAYEEEMEIYTKWREFRQRVDGTYGVPGGMSVKKIDYLTKLIFYPSEVKGWSIDLPGPVEK